MRRGTRVAQAYVAISGDGSGLNDDIVDAFDDTDFKKIGREANGEFSAGWNNASRKNLRDYLHSLETDSLQGLGQALRRMDKALVKNKAFEDGVRQMVGRAFRNGELDQIIDEVGRRTGKKFSGAFGIEAKRAIRDELRKTLEGARGRGESIDLGALIAFDGAEDRLGNFLERASRRVDALAKERARSGGNEDQGLITRIERINALTGRFFGRGSRNNFLNLFGETIGGLSSLVTKFVGASVAGLLKLGPALLEVGKNASLMAQNVAMAFAQNGAAAGLSAFTNSVIFGETTIATAGANIAASVGVMVLAFGALAVAATIVSTVLAALGTIIAALASTITVSLVAGLTVAAAGLGVLAVGAGLVTAAFMSMTDAQKQFLKTTFAPLRKEMVGVGQEIFQQLVKPLADGSTYLERWSVNLQNALALIGPFTSAIGEAVGRAGDIFTKALSGPGFERFAAAFGTWFPQILTNLSTALGNFGNALAGIFAAVLPYVNQFSVYLTQVTDRFSRWANSAGGQNAIADFMDRAVESAKSLWGAVRELSGLIFDVLFDPQIQSLGNSMFDGIADTLRDLRDKFAAAAKDGRLAKWLDSVERFARAMGKAIKTAAKIIGDLVDSGTLDAIANLIANTARAAEWAANGITSLANSPFGRIAREAAKAAGALAALVFQMNQLPGGGGGSTGLEGMKKGKGSLNPFAGGSSSLGGGRGGLFGRSSANIGSALARIVSTNSTKPSPEAIRLQKIGATAQAATSVKSGGTRSGGGKGGGRGFKNPYAAYAQAAINSGPSEFEKLKQSLRESADGVREALTDTKALSSLDSAQSAISSQVERIREAGVKVTETAQEAVNDAAQALLGAKNKKQAKALLAQLKTQQANLTDAIAKQGRINDAAAMLDAQKVMSEGNVLALINGLAVQNATLADYAEARARVAQKLQDAQTKLTDAIQLRSSYITQVADSLKAFGALTTAQAQTLDGVQQSLTAGDITTNLQERLDKIKGFQNDLQLLLANGLSNDAYKQIVDAGVEAGSTYAEALLAGGTGSIAQVNSLVSQINATSDALGQQVGSRLYDAGVQAAQGLVDGLTSLSAQLDAAAVSLGNSIANSIAAALGIHSPSRRLRDMMDYVGDGAVVGLDAQHAKVGAAGQRFADQIAVSPEVAAYASRQNSASAVSGNDGNTHHWHIETPTEDPHAVAMEVLSEVTGRL